jgi:hypothetical protein
MTFQHRFRIDVELPCQCIEVGFQQLTAIQMLSQQVRLARTVDAATEVS